MNELAYCLALWRVPNVGPIQFNRLRAAFPQLEQLFKTSSSKLSELGVRQEVIKGITQPDWSNVERDLRWAEDQRCHIISLDNAEYPALLKEIASAPPLLFVQGNLSSLSVPQIAMVGSRRPSHAAQDIAYQFAIDFVQAGLAVTSGLALGIDAASHRGALSASGQSLAVLGSGLDQIYPLRHKDLAEKICDQGALVSEFPLGVRPLAANFPRRNRIVSGLSYGTLVVEAALNSGSLITAHLANEQGREVFAVPGSIYNPLTRGCHALIRQGAKLVENATDVLEEMPIFAQIARNRPEKLQNPLADNYIKLLECIGYEATATDTIAIRSGMPRSQLLAMLLTLELEGHIAAALGGYVALSN